MATSRPSRAQRRAVHRARRNLPAVVVDGRRASSTARSTNARRRCRGSPRRCDRGRRRSARPRDGRRRRTALAHAQIDRHLRRSASSSRRSTRTRHAHRRRRLRRVSIVSAGLHCAAVQPDQAEPGAGHLEQRREAVLGLRAVVMRRERRRPRLALRLVDTSQAARRRRTVPGPLFCSQCAVDRAVGEADHRRHVGPVHEPVVTRRDQSRLGPSGAGALRKLQRRRRATPLDPAEQDAAIRHASVGAERCQPRPETSGSRIVIDRACAGTEGSTHRDEHRKTAASTQSVRHALIIFRAP